MTTEESIRILDHVEVHDRGTDRMEAKHGRVFYVKNGQLHSVDNAGTVHKSLNVEEDDTTTAPTPGFGSWTTADANRPVWLEVDVTVETDGTSAGEVVIDVDEDGGTTADYTLTLGYVDPDNASGAQDKDTTKVYLPPGAQYQIRASSDPNTNNVINTIRQVTA